MSIVAATKNAAVVVAGSVAAADARACKTAAVEK